MTVHTVHASDYLTPKGGQYTFNVLSSTDQGWHEAKVSISAL